LPARLVIKAAARQRLETGDTPTIIKKGDVCQIGKTSLFA
jgi:hypothetical protein